MSYTDCGVGHILPWSNSFSFQDSPVEEFIALLFSAPICQTHLKNQILFVNIISVEDSFSECLQNDSMWLYNSNWIVLIVSWSHGLPEVQYLLKIRWHYSCMLLHIVSLMHTQTHAVHIKSHVKTVPFHASKWFSFSLFCLWKWHGMHLKLFISVFEDWHILPHIKTVNMAHCTKTMTRE